jgi:hypothetical protein
LNGGAVVPAGDGWVRRDAEPYGPGNGAALQHGGYSGAQWKPRAAAIRAALEASPDTPPYVFEGKFSLTLDALCRAQAIVDCLGDWLNTVGIESAAAEVMTATEEMSGGPPGGVRRQSKSRRTEPVLSLLNRWEGRAAMLRRSLGLDAGSFAQIAKDVGLVRQREQDAIEKLAREGAGIREESEAMRAAGYGHMRLVDYRRLKAAGTLPPPDAA